MWPTMRSRTLLAWLVRLNVSGLEGKMPGVLKISAVAAIIQPLEKPKYQHTFGRGGFKNLSSFLPSLLT